VVDQDCGRETTPVRVTTAFNRLLDLPGTRVVGVGFTATTVVVAVGLRRRRLACPHCEHTSGARHDTRPVPSVWRHLDLGARRLEVHARLRRLACPRHGVVTESVPFARPGSRFTRDFEALVGWLATTMDQTALARLVRIDWATVGRIITRVLGEVLDVGQNYLTLVSSHTRAQVVWGAEGRGAATLDTFFTELGPERSAQVQAVSMDMSAGYEKSVRKAGHAPQAVICFDPYHVVALGTKALDTVRREHWQTLRRTDPTAARRFKGARWALLKRPDHLTDEQAATLRRFRRAGGAIWRAYTLREALRAIFAADLPYSDVEHLLEPDTTPRRAPPAGSVAKADSARHSCSRWDISAGRTSSTELPLAQRKWSYHNSSYETLHGGVGCRRSSS